MLSAAEAFRPVFQVSMKTRDILMDPMLRGGPGSPASYELFTEKSMTPIMWKVFAAEFQSRLVENLHAASFRCDYFQGRSSGLQPNFPYPETRRLLDHSKANELWTAGGCCAGSEYEVEAKSVMTDAFPIARLWVHQSSCDSDRLLRFLATATVSRIPEGLNPLRKRKAVVFADF